MDNGPKYPNTKLGKYPHFFPGDAPIWERFIDNFGDSFSGFDYDVKVGSGTEPVEGLGDSYRKMQHDLSTYRIDAIGYTPDAIYIFEIKPDASLHAIGQALNYARLYTRDFNPSKRIIAAIVTDRKMPDMEYLTKEHDILYYVV